MIDNVLLYLNHAVFLLKLRTSERWRNNTPRNRDFPPRKVRESNYRIRQWPRPRKTKGSPLGVPEGYPIVLVERVWASVPREVSSPLQVFSRLYLASRLHFFFLALHLASHSTFEILYIPPSLCVLAIIHITIVDNSLTI